ncbi:polynucleotide kinase-phosphatase [Mycolicibacterium sp. BK634]|uniref:polynucleotide kinase-phosphatase n=1 Tax=Mycolicibacterium sp. BK634 TaxID=2587099 RepID=UPI001611B82D|nr:polynucleotide kinase-phosphatase [Mycolicibacterium sp. BK634]MBB3748189.1 polynucleotide kinase-phosphatase [Mycolicibacterium sp. BK634]
MTRIDIPDMSLVVLVGASGSGKSTFARKHFAPTAVLSSDFFRGLVADDENDQSATQDAFDALHYVASKRLAGGRVTVIDATNVQQSSRAGLVKLAREYHVLPVAIVLDMPESLCVERNAARGDRDFGNHVIRRQRADLRRSLKSLAKEGFRRTYVLRNPDEVDAAEVSIEPLLNDKRSETGPFDVIGDVHGCRIELEALLVELGYVLARDDEGRSVGACHPEGRRVVFVGDLVDRGPDTPGVLRLAMGMVDNGDAICICGNHEDKLSRAMRGRKVTVSHGLAESLEQLGAESDEFQSRVRDFVGDLVAHVVLDDGNLVVAHAGLPASYHGRASGAVRSFALYGDTTGETDEYGLPVRYPWADDYRGRAMVLYGHTPTIDAAWVNGTMCLDTGCVFGGRLTALRYPEREVVSVAAQKVWYEPIKPLTPVQPLGGVGRREPDILELGDVLGKRIVTTRQHGRVTVPAERAAAALEVMSRFAVDPHWLVYLPPTMSPPATSTEAGLLEHPREAFSAYRADGVKRVLCEEKHMGSRAVVLVCRDSAQRRFGIAGGGMVYTRTGRPFFSPEQTEAMLARVRSAIGGLWDELDTDWLLLDAELLPWSAKASGLLTSQYGPVGAAAVAGLAASLDALTDADARGVEVTALRDDMSVRAANAAAYRDAYRRYCRPTDGLDGVTLAPFALLAAEGRSFATEPHSWHLDIADRLVSGDPELFTPTRRLEVDTTSEASVQNGIDWWTELTAAGGEGMVVKPLANLVRGAGGLVQPGVKVRGREYLRIIYGPDYTEHLDQLRQRSLRHKRSMALREYALGLEALDRLSEGEPLWRIHECVFAVLALESEPVDPRL